MFSSIRRRPRKKSDAPTLTVTEVDESSASEETSNNEQEVDEKRHRKKKRQSMLHVHAQAASRRLYEQRRFLFPLGIFIGTVLATTFLTPLHPRFSGLIEDLDLSFSLTDTLPLSLSSLSLSSLDLDFQGFQKSAQAWLTSRDFSVGEELASQGYKAEHPLVLIPGVVSTGLESWSTAPEYRKYFRKRLWGTTTMLRAVITEREKWVEALSLDPITGLDPSPSIKVRAAQGIDAASTFVPGYWIWSKIIENLACLNYDTNNLLLASYDWRLSYGNLEVRDGYFSRLKGSIEGFRKRQGKKVVLVGHSMGATVVTYFLKWVEAEEYGNGGPTWVEDNIEAVVSLAGTHLGVAKSMTAFLSGEMKDTVEMNPAGAYVLEKYFSRKERARLFRGWAGSASLWIKGGDAIWGSLERGAPDDKADFLATSTNGMSGNVTTRANGTLPGEDLNSHANFFSFRARSEEIHGADVDLSVDARGNPVPHLETSPGYSTLSSSAAGEYILQHVPETWQRMMSTNYSNGIERSPSVLEANNADPTKWTNPLEVQLPIAPSVKFYCVYGWGKETERSYYYARGKYESEEPYADMKNPVCLNETDCPIETFPPGHSNSTLPRTSALDLPALRENWIDSSVSITTKDLTLTNSSGPIVRNGVKLGEGDGTVSLISLGAMCVDGWKRERWNPAGIEVKTIEFEHQPDGLDPRGGAHTADHIDILGSTGLNEVVLKIAAGRGHELEDRIVSPIKEYAAKMQWD